MVFAKDHQDVCTHYSRMFGAFSGVRARTAGSYLSLFSFFLFLFFPSIHLPVSLFSFAQIIRRILLEDPSLLTREVICEYLLGSAYQAAQEEMEPVVLSFLPMTTVCDAHFQNSRDVEYWDSTEIRSTKLSSNSRRLSAAPAKCLDQSISSHTKCHVLVAR